MEWIYQERNFERGFLEPFSHLAPDSILFLKSGCVPAFGRDQLAS